MLHHRSMMQRPTETMIEAKRRGPDAQSSGQTIPSRATWMSLCWTWTSGIIFSAGASWMCQTWTKLADSMRNGPICWVYWGESQHKVGTESKDLPNTYGPLLESLVECGGDILFCSPKKGIDHFSILRVAQTLMVPMVVSTSWCKSTLNHLWWMRLCGWDTMHAYWITILNIRRLSIWWFKVSAQSCRCMRSSHLSGGVIIRSSLSHKKLFGGEEKPGTRHCHRSQTERRNKHRGNVCGGKNITRQCWLFAFLAEIKKHQLGLRGSATF